MNNDNWQTYNERRNSPSSEELEEGRKYVALKKAHEKAQIVFYCLNGYEMSQTKINNLLPTVERCNEWIRHVKQKYHLR